jgi:hypothetical protein
VLVQKAEALGGGPTSFLILDNAATHKTVLIKRWLLKRPRVHLVGLLGSAFSSAAPSPAHLSTALKPFEATPHSYNAATSAAPKPFVWTKNRGRDPRLCPPDAANELRNQTTRVYAC